MADKEGKDRLGGFTLRQLLDTTPVTTSPKELKKQAGKRGIVSTVLGAPFRLLFALVKLPIVLIGAIVRTATRAIVEVAKLPLRIGRVILSPFRRT